MLPVNPRLSVELMPLAGLSPAGTTGKAAMTAPAAVPFVVMTILYSNSHHPPVNKYFPVATTVVKAPVVAEITGL